MDVWDSMHTERDEMNLDDMDMPNYMKSIDLGESSGSDAELPTEAVEIPEDAAMGELGAQKSIEELERQDLENRQRLQAATQDDETAGTQLNLQKDLFNNLLKLALRLHTSGSSESDNMRKHLKSISVLHKQLNPSLRVLKSKHDEEAINTRLTANREMLWEALNSETRKWSQRVGLRIGVDIVSQVEREVAERIFEESDMLRYLYRELKIDTTAKQQRTIKKQKHRFSKHRKLRYDIHDHLVNFMAAKTKTLEPREETIIKNLFGRKDEAEEKVKSTKLDIPLL